MNFIPDQHEENSPYIQLLTLTCYAIAGIVLGTILSLLVIMLFHGTAGLSNTAGLQGEDSSFSAVLKISQVLTTVCLFIFPAVLLARNQKIKFTEFYGFKKPSVFLLVLVLIIMLCSGPLMEWVALTNQKMVFPDFLKPVQDWMREKEDAASKMMLLFLKTRNLMDFVVNLFLIAVLPAISEELIFRGAIQRTFRRLFNNPHVAIWVTAFIFSAIHLQFFGFFPRMILGAIFGYIYLWTGSLWYAMFAHFLNNAYATALAWYFQAHNMSLTEIDNTANFKWYGYIISLILTILLLVYFKYKTTYYNGKQLD